jgi:hypothetical protein
MAKSMSVTFADGTSHTYDNIPDSVTQEQVDTRARTDYPDKQVVGVSAGAAPEAPKPLPAAPEASTGEKILGGAQTAFGIGNALLDSPIGHALEIVGGAAYGKKVLGDIAGKFGNAMNPNAVKMQNGQAFRGGQPGFNEPARPVRPTPFTNGANTAFDEAMARQQPGRFAQLAQRFAPVAIPAAVAGGGAYLSNAAANTVRGMTPEARDMMQGDVGSDTAFAAAILNQATKQQEIDDRIRQAAAAKALRPIAPGQ